MECIENIDDLLNMDFNIIEPAITEIHPEAEKIKRMLKLLLKNYPGCYNPDLINGVLYFFPSIKKFEINILLGLIACFGIQIDDLCEKESKGLICF